MKRLSPLLLLSMIWGQDLLAWKSPPPFFRTVYSEVQDGKTRRILARKKEGEVIIERREGNFPAELKENPPWYIWGLSPFDGDFVLQIDSLPSLKFQPKLSATEEATYLKEKTKRERYALKVSAREEEIPLNKGEEEINALLKPHHIQEIFLEGEAEVFFLPEEKLILGEKLFLKGIVVRGGKKEQWRIDWAGGIGW